MIGWLQALTPELLTGLGSEILANASHPAGHGSPRLQIDRQGRDPAGGFTCWTNHDLSSNCSLEPCSQLRSWVSFIHSFLLSTRPVELMLLITPISCPLPDHPVTETLGLAAAALYDPEACWEIWVLLPWFYLVRKGQEGILNGFPRHRVWCGGSLKTTRMKTGKC